MVDIKIGLLPRLFLIMATAFWLAGGGAPVALAEDEAPAGDAARAERAAPPVLTQTVTLFPQLDLQRSLGPDFYLRVQYDILAWGHFRGAVGLSLSFTPFCVDGYYLDLRVENVAGTGLGAGIKFMGDQYPEYGRAANTLNPYVFWRYAFVDLAFGVVWRFLVTDPAWLWCMFDYDPFMVEPMFYYKIGFVFALFDRFWTLSISLSNQDEFYVGNFGTFTLLIGNRLAIDQTWSVFFDFLWRPSGTIALSAVNSVFIFRAGGRLSL